MKIVIEFYRIRQDGAHAVDPDDAIEVAWARAQTLDMPRQPDAQTIADASGRTLYSCTCAAPKRGEMPAP